MEEEIEQPKVAQEDPREAKIRDLKSQIKSLKSELAQAAQASSSYAYDEKKRTEELEALRALRVVRFYFWSKRAISAARSVDEWKQLGLRLLVGSVAFVEETGRRLSGAFKILVFGAA